MSRTAVVSPAAFHAACLALLLCAAEGRAQIFPPAGGLPFRGSTNSPNVAALSISNTATSGLAVAVYGQSDSPDGYGIRGVAAHASGASSAVVGSNSSTSGTGVFGSASAASGTTYGGYFQTLSIDGRAVFGTATATSGTNYGGYFRSSSPGGIGVYGLCNATSGVNYGVFGETSSQLGIGVYGKSNHSGGLGGYFQNGAGVALHAVSGAQSNIVVPQGAAIRGDSDSTNGVIGSTNAVGASSVMGVTENVQSNAGYYENEGGGRVLECVGHLDAGGRRITPAVTIMTDAPDLTNLQAAAGASDSIALATPNVTGDYTNGSPVLNYGLYGSSKQFYGMYAASEEGTALYAVLTGSEGSGYAAMIDGSMQVNGDFNVTGGSKNFKIDHPLDPAHQYLLHAAIESDDRKNMYDGVVTLDAAGQGIVMLPAWFEALNTNFRYQLTPIGGPAPNLHIAQPIRDNAFRIAGGPAGIQVSWQVSGVRGDAYAAAHPFQVEQPKRGADAGKYLAPAEYHRPAEDGISHSRKLQHQGFQETWEARLAASGASCRK